MSENYVRGWAFHDAFDLFSAKLWLEIDLFDGIPKTADMKRFAFLIDVLVESDLGKNSELWAILNEKGYMNVLSVENVAGPKSLAKVFLIARDLVLPHRFPVKSPRLDFFACSNSAASIDTLGDLSLFVHDYTGVILHYTAVLNRWLKADEYKYCFSEKSILTGHRKSVQRLLRTADGRALLSMSRFSENYVWKAQYLKKSITLRRECLINVAKNQVIRHAIIMRNGDFVVALQEETIVVWDCRCDVAKPLAALKLQRTDEPILFFLLPEAEQLNHGYHLFALYANKLGNLWRVSLPLRENKSGHKTITDFGSMEFPSTDDIHKAVRVDPVGWSATVGADHLDTFQRDVLATISEGGRFVSWTATLNRHNKVDWLQTACLETGKDNISRMEVSSIRKVAIANRDATELSIWDTNNHILEFQMEFTPDFPLSDLDWTSTPDSQSILGVGSAQVVTLYTQLRFDYTNKTAAWTPIKTIDISDYTTHSIGDSIWLEGGALAIGAGNQFFIKDNSISVKDDTTRQLLGKQNVSNETNSLFEACAIMNGPLPVYHPQLLIQSIFAGKLEMVKRILVTLLNAIKFAVVLDSNVIDIESTIGLTPEQLLELHDLDSSAKPDDELNAFNDVVCTELLSWLQKASLPYMTQHQQITLASVIEAINRVLHSSAAIDGNGLKYLLGFSLFKIHKGIQESMTIRDFNWALHSNSKDVILEIIENRTSKPIMWPSVRDLGLPYWVGKDKLKVIFERLGQNHFSVGQRDPVACSIFYLALRKKQLLIGLWRTASWNREQTKTIALLSRDFTVPKNKTTAQKNAYALLAKHRYEYAAAFFILADALKDAVNVLVKQVKDVSLAIAVARVYGGEDCTELKGLLEHHVLPKAARDGDRWMASWALWQLGNRPLAIKALAHPPRQVLAGVLEEAELQNEGDDNKLFLGDDPVLSVLYQYLRAGGNGGGSGGGSIPCQDQYHLPSHQHHPASTDVEVDEFQFVAKTANIYARMGCDILALDLVRSWKFPITTTTATSRTASASPASYSIADSKPIMLNGGHSFSEKKPIKAGLIQASAVAFEEPDMSAFSFGV